MHERMEGRGPAARGGRATVPEGERAREGGSLRGLGKHGGRGAALLKRTHEEAEDVGVGRARARHATRTNQPFQGAQGRLFATVDQVNFEVAASDSGFGGKGGSLLRSESAVERFEVHAANNTTAVSISASPYTSPGVYPGGYAKCNASMDVYETRLTNLRSLVPQAGGRPQMARRLDMAYTLLTNYIGPKPAKRIGDKVARRVEQAFDLPPGWMDQPHEYTHKFDSLKSVDSQKSVTLDGYVTVPGFTPARADEFTLVPRLDARASCGGGADNGDHPVELEPLAFRNAWLRDKGARDPVVIDARGDSMSPFIVHGDVILFDRARTNVASGQIYLVQTPDGLRVKRVHKEFDGSITLRSDNPDKVRFPDERVPPELVPQFVVVGSFVWRGGG